MNAKTHGSTTRTGPPTPAHEAHLVSIAGVSGVLPGRDLPGGILTNQELSHLMAEVREHLLQGAGREIPISTPAFPEERIGVLERGVLDAQLTVRDLAIAAGRRALTSAQVLASRIQCVLVTTVTPDRTVPPVATTVADALGLPPGVLAADLVVGCNGFLVAIDLAQHRLAQAAPGACALVIGAETMTRVVDASDRTTCPIFGDGAGAVVLRREAGTRPIPIETQTLGAAGENIEIAPPDFAGGAPAAPPRTYRFRSTDGRVDVAPDPTSQLRVTMRGQRVFRDMVRLLPARIETYLAEHELAKDDVDWFVFHQANARLLEAVANALGVDKKRVPLNIARVGNTTSASIPLLLSDLLQAGRLRPGHRVLLVGFGTGYSLSIAHIEWHSCGVSEVPRHPRLQDARLRRGQNPTVAQPRRREPGALQALAPRNFRNTTRDMQHATPEALLDQTHEELRDGDPRRAMRDLFFELDELRARSNPDDWQAALELAASHPVRDLLHQDPMCRRSFDKPRGYPGDAVLLDYIYRLLQPADTTPVGRAIYDYAVSRPAACAVRHRKEWIAHGIDRACDRADGHARVLSIASGHLREADSSIAIRNGWLGELVALDADERSLSIVDEARHPGVRTTELSIGRLLGRPERLGKFHFVYSAGLYDYLEPALARRLTACMFDMLEPGGRLLVSNFLPTLPDAGYMEAFMGWELIYRTEDELAGVLSDLPQQSLSHTRVYSDPFAAIAYAEATRLP